MPCRPRVPRARLPGDCVVRLTTGRKRPCRNGHKYQRRVVRAISLCGRSRVSVSKLSVYESIYVYISRAARRYPGRIVRRDYSSLPPPQPGKRGTALVRTIYIYIFFLCSSVDQHRVFFFARAVVPPQNRRRARATRATVWVNNSFLTEEKVTLDVLTKKHSRPRSLFRVIVRTYSKSNTIAENPDGLHTEVEPNSLSGNVNKWNFLPSSVRSHVLKIHIYRQQSYDTIVLRRYCGIFVI